LQKLDEWNNRNPERTVMCVLKSVHDKLDILESQSFQKALDLIPDSPFPAGHLVKCLVNLLLVGTVSPGLGDRCISNEIDVEFQRLPEVKSRAYQFTIDAVEDLNRMVEAFGKGTAPDDMLAGSWRDLKAMRYDGFRSVVLPAALTSSCLCAFKRRYQ
jgi:hypothetical protein